MTLDDLVNKLREFGNHARRDDGEECVRCDAADAIEALVKEVRSLNAECQRLEDGQFARAEAAEAKVEALVKERDDEIERRQAVSLSLEAAEAEVEKWRSDHRAQSKRLTSAEAEVLKWQTLAANHEHEHKMALSQVAKLKEALTKIASFQSEMDGWYVKVAQNALGGK